MREQGNFLSGAGETETCGNVKQETNHNMCYVANVHTFMLRHPFLQMEKRLPFNFPFANSRTLFLFTNGKYFLEFS
jgi:hypothetical protein